MNTPPPSGPQRIGIAREAGTAGTVVSVDVSRPSVGFGSAPLSSASERPTVSREVAGEAPAAGSKLNILVRRDFSQKSYRMAMAVHAALVWEHWRSLGIVVPNAYTAGDWQGFPNHGPVIAIYGVENRAELTSWWYRLSQSSLGSLHGAALYSEPDLPVGEQEAALAWYGVMPPDHGLRLL